MIDIHIVLQETPKIVVWWVEIGAVWTPDIGGFIGDQLVTHTFAHMEKLTIFSMQSKTPKYL